MAIEKPDDPVICFCAVNQDISSTSASAVIEYPINGFIFILSIEFVMHLHSDDAF